MEKFHIVFASDNSFAMQIGVSLLSLLKNNSDLKLCVYILANNISNENKINLEKIAMDKAELKFVDVSEFLNEKIKNQGIAIYANAFAPYSRLCVAEALPANISKVLYLDGDTIVNGSLAELAQMDIATYSCAMVKDIRSEKYKKKIGLENIYEFYNSGVILINLDFWREHSVGNTILNDILLFPTEFPDNNAFCRVLKGKIKTLPLSYNVTGLAMLFNNESLRKIAFRSEAPFYSEQELNEAKENPVILHYTNYYLSGRPWFEDCFDSRGLAIWDSYFNNSPWAGYSKPKRQYRRLMLIYVKITRFLYNILPQKLFVIFIARFIEKFARCFAFIVPAR
jgi:lipopolysaccharide biosynthesis glycosyltransferase